jgi:NADH dehydrogenase
VPLTRNQIELMQIDNIANAQQPGFRDLEVQPSDIDQVVRSIRKDP